MHAWQINSAPFGYDEEGRRDILSGYFAAVTAMDANLGRLLDWLEAHGLRENTLVFFTSDNGMNMGHHGIYGKGNGTFPQNMYDTSVKVPALFSRPGYVPEGAVEEGLYSHYDYMPTLLDYLGYDCPDADELPGQSFAPLLRGEPCPERETVVVTGSLCDAVYDEYGPVRMIRTPEAKYVHRYPYGPHEFYDLVSDPGERENLVDSPTCHAQIEALKAQLDAWFVRFADPARDGAREPVTGKGQLGLVGHAGKGEPVFADDWYYLRSGDQTRA
jgi:arylsulfatase A-like enzyme